MNIGIVTMMKLIIIRPIEINICLIFLFLIHITIHIIIIAIGNISIVYLIQNNMLMLSPIPMLRNTLNCLSSSMNSKNVNKI